MFLFVVAAGAVARLGVVWFYAEALDVRQLPDEVQYWDLAQSIADGQGLADELGYRAARMPLYPAFLAPFAKLTNGLAFALALQAALSALACGFTALLAWQIAPGRTRALAAVLAGLLVALDPFLVYFSRLLLTESLFLCALCALFAISWPLTEHGARCRPWRWFISGVLCGLCVYLRPSALGLVVAWWMFALLRRRLEKEALLGVCGWALMLILMLSPWAARNKSVTGEWIWLTTRLGISLYDGVHPQATGASDLGDLKSTGQDEVVWNREFKAKSWRHIRTEPGRMIRLAGRKFARTWNLWPNAEGYRGPWIKMVLGTWTALILLTAAWGVKTMRGAPATIMCLLLPAIYFTSLHMVFVGSVRYRLPAMPMIIVLSAVGIAAILDRPGRNRETPQNATHS
jgi:4-amino-4-deoxy-L-arabinose transferase-like glycosyltransferase